ncbi:MFS transporter [Sphingomonas flavalba]|uniref:MFS transporter n=1 Tax=Sphingomonas flavalba TaxID=2559804 RepID=UPI0039E0C811
MVSRSEWKAGWPLVVVGMLGVSLSSLATYTLGLFMSPLEQEFGWSRAQASSALTLVAISPVLLAPVVGAMIDRWGTRRLALPGVLLVSLSFAAMSLNTGALYLWWSLWLWLGLANLLIKTTIWTTAIAGMFDKARGMAIALTLCGTGIASSGGPIIARWLIDDYGWRTAFLGMGLGWGVVVVPAVFFLFFDARARSLRQQASADRPAPPREAVPGLSVREALRSRSFLAILTSTFLINTVITALIVHLVPILVSKGMTRSDAAVALGVFGFAAAFGKLGSGWLLDRAHGRVLGTAVLAIPALPCLILIFTPVSMPIAILIVALIAVGSGAELQTLTYLCTRYVGLRNFGKLYGVFGSLVGLCLAVGPLCAGLIFDRVGHYQPLFYAVIPIALLCSFLMSTLGAYPIFSPPRKADGEDVLHS